MIWLTWRQHRPEMLVLAAALVAAAVGMVVIDQVMAGAASRLGLTGCVDLSTGPCASSATTFATQFSMFISLLETLLMAVPVLVGMFIGAPLVSREIERGTHRLVWSQGVSRTRWLMVKSAGVLLLGAGAAAVLTLEADRAFTPYLDVAQVVGRSRFDPMMFDVLGIVPVAYTVFALTLGMIAGSLLRRTLAAMLVVLVVFIGIRVPITALARPHYLPPVTQGQRIPEAPPEPQRTAMTVRINAPPGSLHLGGTVDCDPNGPICRSFTITYQPAGRYWLFQGIESAIYLAISALLLGLTAFWVRRRTT